jgi:hypothetical protein
MAETTTVDVSPVVADPAPTPPPASATPIAFNTSDLIGEEGVLTAHESPSVPGLDVTEYGFDDESIKQYDFELYKGRKGVTDRIGLLALPLGARVHFKPGIGYLQCLSKWTSQIVAGAKLDVCVKRAACCVHCDSPRKRFITPIVQYATQPNGQLTPTFGYGLKAFLYSDDKYIAMRGIHSEFSLLDHDLLVTCTEEQYQKLTMAPCKQALWKSEKLPKELREEIKLWVDSQRPKMGRMLGKKLNENELLVKLGIATPQATVAAGVDAPMVDVKGLLDD